MALKGDAEKAALPGECGGLLASLTWTLLEERSVNRGTQRCGRRVSRAPPRGILQYVH